MKKIITAMGDSLINDTLKNKEKYIMQTPDIELEDDLIEAIKSKKDTEILILNIEIIKKEKIYNYINKIKQVNQFIKIIAIIQEETDEIKNVMLACGIKDIFYGNEITIAKLEDAIDRNKTTEEILTEEINNLKEIILKEKKNKEKKPKNNNFLKNKLINRTSNKNE